MAQRFLFTFLFTLRVQSMTIVDELGRSPEFAPDEAATTLGGGF
jgi:hypothetical protein